MFLSILIFVVHLASAYGSSVFVEDPGPGLILSPVGTPVKLNCSVVEGYAAHWEIDFPDRPAIRTNTLNAVDLLLMRGVEAVATNTLASELIFLDKHESNSSATVRCIAVNNDLLNTYGEQVKVIFYGVPPAPSNLAATASGQGSLNISWSLDFIEEVPVNFTLTTLDLSSSSPGRMVISDIQEEYYIFSAPNGTCMDVYSFNVTAMVDIGSSDSSEVITSSIPSPPEMIVAKDSVEYFLVKTEEEFELRIRIKNASTCQDYPTVSYAVHVDLNDLTENGTVATTSNITATTSIVLMEDLHYEYSIVLVNEIGESSKSEPVDIFTSDVQSVSICQLASTTYIIQCAYVIGSNGRGCVYLITEPTQENVTGTIERSNLNGVMVELPNGYSEVVIYDWENDDTTGILPIREIDNTITCLVTRIAGNLTPPTDELSTDIIIIIIVVVAVFASLLLLILLIIACCISKKKKSYSLSEAKEMVKIQKVASISDAKKAEVSSSGTNELMGAKVEPITHEYHNTGSPQSPKLPEISWQQHSAMHSEPVVDEPIYSTPTPTGKTPLATGAGLLEPSVFNADQGYSSINLVAAPSTRKAKLKAKDAFSVRQPPPIHRQPRAAEEDGLYSTVSNAPKISSKAGIRRNMVSQRHASESVQGVSRSTGNVHLKLSNSTSDENESEYANPNSIQV